MTIFDPLEPLRQTLEEIKTVLGWEGHYMETLRRAGLSVDSKTLGEIGALFAHLDELRKDNEVMLKETLTQGEIELRQTIGKLLDQLIQVLKEFRGL